MFAARGRPGARRRRAGPRGGGARAARPRRRRRRLARGDRRRRRHRPASAWATSCSPTPAARARLEAITHPRIRALGEQRAGRAGRRRPPAGDLRGDAAGREPAATATSTASSWSPPRPETQLARVRGPRAGSPGAGGGPAAAQLPLAEKLRVATHVIDNDGDLAATEAQVDACWRSSRDLAASKGADRVGDGRAGSTDPNAGREDPRVPNSKEPVRGSRGPGGRTGSPGRRSPPRATQRIPLGRRLDASRRPAGCRARCKAR